MAERITRFAPHFVLTLGRSGSNYFVNIINQHPQLLNFGEVLGPWTMFQKWTPASLKRIWGQDTLLDTVLDNPALLYGSQALRLVKKRLKGEAALIKRKRDLRSVGVKDFSLNLYRLRMESYLEARPNIRVIALQRRDVLARLISYKMLESSGVIAARTGETSPVPQTLRLNPDSFPDLLAEIESENRALEAMISRLPQERVLRLEYESCFCSTQAQVEAARRIYDFLDADPFEPKANMRKIINRPPHEVIENWEACRDSVRGTRLEKLLPQQT
jgi:hypothetical protein